MLKIFQKTFTSNHIIFDPGLNKYLMHQYIQMSSTKSPQKTSKPKLYAISVSGISCINCAKAIKTILNQKIGQPTMKVSVDIIKQKILITVFQEKTIQNVLNVLQETKFKPINGAIQISGSKQSEKKILIFVSKAIDILELQVDLANLTGVKSLSYIQVQNNEKIKIQLTYDCQIIKGRDIGDCIEKYDSQYEVINQKLQSLAQKKDEILEASIKQAVILCLYFFVIFMIFPVLPYIKEFYYQCMSFPQTFGVYSLSVIINIGVTLYVLNNYARGFIERAYKNYKEFNSTNMETLIALGSVSAFTLFLFFLIRYSIDSYHGTLEHQHMAIMDINDALTSASIIVLIVTIGKHVQKKAKKKITQITQKIFPQSVLFNNMKIQYPQLKNKKYDLINSKNYDVNLIEKGDIIKVNCGRLLVDLIIVKGSVKAVQSARTGNDNLIFLNAGQRLESGAIVEQAIQCFGQVQNSLEQSLLIQLFTHVKFSQNQEEAQTSGIQAVCLTITDIFVKVVIFLSLFTMFVWTVIILLNLVNIQICHVCWVFERGIGILVASCPCALGLAVPTVIAIILNLAINSGILIKSNKSFEKMKTVKKIAFDKTGTLFNKIQRVQNFKILSQKYAEEQMWQMLAIMQKQVRHPLAETIYRYALDKLKSIIKYNYALLQKPSKSNHGLYGKITKKSQQKSSISILIGNKVILSENNIQVPSFQNNSQGSTLVYLVADDQVLMVMVFNTHSNLRAQAFIVIQQIEKLGIDIHILSGDSKESVQKLGKQLRLKPENLHFQFNSFDKLEWIKDNQKNSQTVIMVGDGLNDIPCLQQAGIGISINAKSQLNINAADIIILSQNLYKILALIRFLQKGNLFIKINLFWAFAYNIVIMPIVAGCFYNWGVFISPIWSSISMSLSSIIVVSFSYMLQCLHYDDSLRSRNNVSFKHRDVNDSKEVIVSPTQAQLNLNGQI